MAVAIRRRLHNPAGRRRRRRNLTAKQLKYFGTKAQKAAAKRRNRAKFAARHRRRTNPPAAAPRKRRHRRRARRNVGEIVELALGNPHRATHKKRRNNVERTRRRRGGRRRHRRRSNPPNPYYAARANRRRRRRNYGYGRRRNPSTRRRRSNPAALGGITPFVTGAAWAIGGAVGTRMLTQAVLGAQNQSWLGYGGNMIAAFALGAAAQMATRNRSTRNFVILGGVIATLQRILTDMTPLGRRLSLSGMGDYMVQGFLTPQRLVNGLHSAQIEYPPQLRPPVVVSTNAAGEPGLRGLGRRRLM